MNLNEMLSSLHALQAALQAYSHALSVLQTDGETAAPVGASEARGETMAFLDQKCYELLVNDDTRALLDGLWDKKDELDLGAYSWKIYTADVSTLPAYIGDKAETDRVYITQGCECSGKVTHTVMFTNSKVAEGATVTDSVLMPGAVVDEGATVIRAMIANGVRIGKGAVVGSADSEHIELVSKNVKGVE